MIITALILAILLTTIILSARTLLNRIDEEPTDWWDEQ
jgi:hypothetical protein